MAIKLNEKTVSSSYESLTEAQKVLSVDAGETWSNLRPEMIKKGIVNQSQIVRARHIFNAKVEAPEISSFTSLEALATDIYESISASCVILPIDICTFQTEVIAENIKAITDLQFFNSGAHKTVSVIIKNNDMLLSEVQGGLNVSQTKKQLEDIPTLKAAGLKTLDASALFPTPWGTEAFISKKITGSVSTRIVEGVKPSSIGTAAISNSKFYSAIVTNGVYSDRAKLETCIGHLERLYAFTKLDVNKSFFSDLQCLIEPSGDLTFHDPSECKVVSGGIKETYKKKHIMLKKLIDVLNDRLTKLGLQKH